MAEAVEDSVVNVLIVEDDQAVVDMYRMKLELDGYRVTVARDGEEGLSRAFEDHPDIIFLDVRLPGKDGFEVLQELRASEQTRGTPVIILSNYGQQEMIDRGITLGANEFLIKAQTTPTSLSEGIDEWLKE